MKRLTSKRTWNEAKQDLVHELGYQYIWERLNEIENVLGDDYDLERLKELVEADREGKCVVLPCKVGDTVYCLYNEFGDDIEIQKGIVKEYESYNNGWFLWIHLFYDTPTSKIAFAFLDFGKTVFLTREEAEVALEKMKEREK